MQHLTTTTQTHRRDSVLVPRSEYQAFKRWHESVRIQLDDAWFWTLEWQKKEAEADKDIQKGKVSGPFSDVRSLMRDLKTKTK